MWHVPAGSSKPEVARQKNNTGVVQGHGCEVTRCMQGNGWRDVRAHGLHCCLSRWRVPHCCGMNYVAVIPHAFSWQLSWAAGPAVAQAPVVWLAAVDRAHQTLHSCLLLAVDLACCLQAAVAVLAVAVALAYPWVDLATAGSRSISSSLATLQAVTCVLHLLAGMAMRLALGSLATFVLRHARGCAGVSRCAGHAASSTSDVAACICLRADLQEGAGLVCCHVCLHCAVIAILLAAGHDITNKLVAEELALRSGHVLWPLLLPDGCATPMHTPMTPVTPIQPMQRQMGRAHSSKASRHIVDHIAEELLLYTLWCLASVSGSSCCCAARSSCLISCTGRSITRRLWSAGRTFEPAGTTVVHQATAGKLLTAWLAAARSLTCRCSRRRLLHRASCRSRTDPHTCTCQT